MTRPANILWFLASVVVTIAILSLWQLISVHKLVPPLFLPPPTDAFASIVSGMTQGDLLAKLGATVARVFGSWVIASIVGIALGSIIGISQQARIYVSPTLEALRPLPVSALAPIFIALFGYSEQAVVSMIAFGAFWPTLLSTVHGFSAVEPRLYEVGRALRLNRLEVITKISLPAAVPDIFAGVRIALTVSLILVVVGEMLASREGLGYGILLSQRTYQSAELFAGIIPLGLIGYVSSLLLDLLERRLITWR